MTRDEAIEKFSNTRLHMFGERRAENWIEVFEVLGLLNLDEPKKHNKAFCRAYNTLDEEGHHAAQILSLLDDAGLKIVEK